MRLLKGMDESVLQVNPTSEARNPKPETRSPKPEARSPKTENRRPKPETRNQKPETRNQKPKHKPWFGGPFNSRSSLLAGFLQDLSETRNPEIFLRAATQPSPALYPRSTLNSEPSGVLTLCHSTQCARAFSEPVWRVITKKKKKTD